MTTREWGAVVLAAGFGTRLAPLTDRTPKPLLTLGRTTVIDHILQSIGRCVPNIRIVVVTNDQHRDAWAEWNERQPNRIVVASNGVTSVDDRLGAVADMARGVDLLGDVERIAVLAGDNVIVEPMAPHLAAATADGLPIVLCRDLGDDVPPGRFGEVTVDDAGRIIAFREKPADPQSPLAATCTYLLPGAMTARWLHDYLSVGDADSPGSFVAWLAARTAVLARPLTGSYFDIGNHATLAQAREHFAEPGT